MEYLSLNNVAISEEELKKNTEYTNALLDVSNDIIVFNLLEKNADEKILEEVEKGI